MKKVLFNLMLASLLVLLASASSALAAPPDIVRFSEPFEWGLVDCGDFIVYTRGMQDTTVKTFFDENGDAFQAKIFVRITESEYYNSEDDTHSISQGVNGIGENATATVDLATGEEIDVGALFRLTIPGVGRVLMHVGKFLFDEDRNLLYQAGQNWFLAEGDTGYALCEALTP